VTATETSAAFANLSEDESIHFNGDGHLLPADGRS